MWNRYCPDWMLGWGMWWVWDLLWLAILAGGVYLIVRLASRSGSKSQASRCPSCGGVVEDAFLRCPECGHRLKQNCQACGKVIKTSWDICPYCESDPKAELA